MGQPKDDSKFEPIDLRIIKKKQRAGTASVHINSSSEEITVTIDQVVIDGTYQRNLSMTWARKIAKDFDPEMFGKPLLARRSDGKYAVIDGQHRIAALRILYPNQSVTFQADLEINADTQTKQAKSFTARNTYVKRTSSGDELRALIAGEDPEALQYQEILFGNGYRHKWGGGRTRPGEVGPYVFKSVRKFCRDTWASDLDGALKVWTAAWGVSGFPVDSALLVGIALVFRRFSNDIRFNPDRLADRIRKKTPMALAADGNVRAQIDSTRKEYGARILLRNLFNQRLDPKNQLPEF